MGKMLHDSTKSGKTRLGTLEERAEHALEVAKRAMGPLHGDDESAPDTANQGEAPSRKQPARARKAAEPASADDTQQRLTEVLSTLSTVAKAVGVAALMVRTGSTLVQTVRTIAPGHRFWSSDRDRTLGSVAILGVGVLVGAGAAVALGASRGDRPIMQRLEAAKRKATGGAIHFAEQLFGAKDGAKKTSGAARAR